MLLVHGAQDELIPAQALDFTRDALKAAGVPVEAHLREGLGHGIDEEGLRLGAGFLSRHLAGRSAAAGMGTPFRPQGGKRDCASRLAAGARMRARKVKIRPRAGLKAVIGRRMSPES